MCKPSLAQDAAKAFVVAWALAVRVSEVRVSEVRVSEVRGAAAGCKEKALAENNTTSDMMPIVTSSIFC
jgi:hypothetical protein